MSVLIVRSYQSTVDLGLIRKNAGPQSSLAVSAIAALTLFPSHKRVSSN